MQKLKGNVVFWSVRDFDIPKERLEEALASVGFEPEQFIPRNDFKSAMIKALKTLNKDHVGEGDQDYKRFHDEGQFASFTVYELNPSGQDVDFNKKLTIKLDKTHGNIEVVSQTASDIFVAKLRDLYAKEKESLNSSQFRATVLRVVEKECRGFSMRPGGGVYFINPAFDSKRLKLQELFAKFRQHMEFHSVPVYDDEGTMNALQAAATADIFSDVEALIKNVERDFKAGVITRRRLEGDRAKAQEIFEKIKIHSEHLRSEAENISRKLSKVVNALDTVSTKIEHEHVEPTEFTDLLKGL